MHDHTVLAGGCRSWRLPGRQRRSSSERRARRRWGHLHTHCLHSPPCTEARPAQHPSSGEAFCNEFCTQHVARPYTVRASECFALGETCAWARRCACSHRVRVQPASHQWATLPTPRVAPAGKGARGGTTSSVAAAAGGACRERQTQPQRGARRRAAVQDPGVKCIPVLNCRAIGC